MPGPKSSGHQSKTNGPEGQKQLFADELLERAKKDKEAAKNRLAEIDREMQAKIQEAVAPLVEEKQKLEVYLGVKKTKHRLANSRARTGLRDFIRQALAGGRKMGMSELCDAVEQLGYEPAAGGTYPAVYQALRALREKGEVTHLKDEEQWQLEQPSKGQKKK